MTAPRNITGSRRVQLYPAAALRWKLNEAKQPFNSLNPFVNGGTLGTNGDLVNPGTGAKITSGVRGILQRGAQFFGPDGTNRHCAYSALPTAVIAGSVLAISAWIFPMAFNANGYIVGKSYDSNLANWATPFTSWVLLISDTSGNVQLQLTTGTAGAGTRSFATSTTPIRMYEWTLLSAVYDSINMRVYANGCLMPGATTAKTGAIDNSTTNSNFGGHHFVGAPPSTHVNTNNVAFAGIVEEVVVETTAPSEEVLRQRYLDGLGLFEQTAT